MAKPFEIDYIYVRSVRFGDKSSLENGVLTINRDELRALCASDLFSRLDIELASPGESCRILAIHDVMQPRCKVEHPEETYPGILGKLAPAGEGKTLALKGVVVSDIYYAKCNIKYYLDMGGQAARYSHFSKHFHVCIDAEPAEGVSDASYAEALKLASLKANVYLAKLGLGQKADYSERFEWNPIEYKPGEKRLPRVAYFATHLASHDTWNFLFYGQSALGFLPMVVQPTEILDGAMVWRYWEPNYYLQNEMYIKELLNRHGKDLEFVGCVFANNVMRLDGKETMGMIGARLCRDTLHADCVVVNKSGMGHAQLDSALAFNWMEKFGSDKQPGRSLELRAGRHARNRRPARRRGDKQRAQLGRRAPEGRPPHRRARERALPARLQPVGALHAHDELRALRLLVSDRRLLPDGGRRPGMEVRRDVSWRRH